MSETQKSPNLVTMGGQHFSKMSEIQKCPNLLRRGGQYFSKMSGLNKMQKLTRQQILLYTQFFKQSKDLYQVLLGVYLCQR